MTKLKYKITRFTQFFGAFNRNKHLNAAASETQLYVEAQRFLGADVWEFTEKIEGLEVEYWTLRNLLNERNTLTERLQQQQEKLDQTHERRKSVVSQWKAEIEELEDARKKLITKQAIVRSNMQETRTQGQIVRKKFEAYKMQIKVNLDNQAHREQTAAKTQGSESNSSTEGGVAIIPQLEELMESQKAEFNRLKESYEKHASHLKRLDKELAEHQTKIDELRASLRSRANDTYSTIGQANQDTSIAKARLRQVDNEIYRLHTHIGRFVLQNYKKSPEVKKLVRKRKMFFNQILLLEDSIRFHQALADLN